MSPPTVPARQQKIRSFRQCPYFETITRARGFGLVVEGVAHREVFGSPLDLAAEPNQIPDCRQAKDLGTD
jgi:hypothetical protein